MLLVIRDFCKQSVNEVYERGVEVVPLHVALQELHKPVRHTILILSIMLLLLYGKQPWHIEVEEVGDELCCPLVLPVAFPHCLQEPQEL